MSDAVVELVVVEVDDGMGVVLQLYAAQHWVLGPSHVPTDFLFPRIEQDAALSMHFPTLPSPHCSDSQSFVELTFVGFVSTPGGFGMIALQLVGTQQ